MTARERTVLRAAIRALNAEGNFDLDAFSTAYGVPYRKNQPVRNQVAALLKALIDADS